MFNLAQQATRIADQQLSPNNRSRHALHDAGIALPASLMLLTLLTMLGVQTYRTAIAEARMIRALAAQQAAQQLAQTAATRGLASAAQNLSLLPPAGGTQALPRMPSNQGYADTAIAFIGADTLCPALRVPNVSREHFELQTLGVVPEQARAAYVQGFFVCRELCSPPCIGAVGAPTRTYWAAVPPP